jgi:hypothetical protein
MARLPLHLIAQLLATMDEIDGLFIRHNFVSAGVGVPASPSEQIAQVSSVPYQEYLGGHLKTGQ